MIDLLGPDVIHPNVIVGVSLPPALAAGRTSVQPPVSQELLGGDFPVLEIPAKPSAHGDCPEVAPAEVVSSGTGATTLWKKERCR